MKMKTMMGCAALSLVFATAAWADAGPAWTCYGQGEQNVGGPVGTIEQTVIGYGDSQIDATDDALQNCWSEGLEMCSVTSCAQNS